jgi:ABC-type glycerol-3-phosphate transport system substrate-binding protein
MNHNYLKVFFISFLLACFLGIAACVTSSGPATTAPAAPVPSYSPQHNDPLFWQMWENEHGLG